MIKKRQLIFLVIVIAIILSSCNSKKNIKYTEKTEFKLGTIVSIKIISDEADSILESAFNILDKIEEDMSKNIENSTVSKINKAKKNERIKINSSLEYVLNKSSEISTLTNGYFDITIGKVVYLWGIGTSNSRVPEKEEIDNALKFVNYRNIIVDDSSVYKKEDEIEIDLGGIAKGYAADEISRFLYSKNISSAIINIGGNVLLHGKKPSGEDYKVGIQDPFSLRNEYFAIVEGSEISVVTSGDYERFFEEAGKTYHHILDYKTGYPSENDIAAVSVISKSSIEGDALSTALYAMGKEKGLKIVEELKDTECIYITNDKKVIISNGLKGKISIKDNSFKFAD